MRPHLRSLIAFSLITLWGSSLDTQAAKPNVVMIIADDQTYRDFGFMGNTEVITPHLDRLASQSARYINGYVPISVCRWSMGLCRWYSTPMENVTSKACRSSFRSRQVSAKGKT